LGKAFLLGLGGQKGIALILIGQVISLEFQDFLGTLYTTGPFKERKLGGFLRPGLANFQPLRTGTHFKDLENSSFHLGRDNFYSLFIKNGHTQGFGNNRRWGNNNTDISAQINS